MASMGVYERSPWDGDLLEFAPTVEESVYGREQDHTDSKAWTSTLIQGHEESSSPQHGLMDTLDFGWMDSNIDLLQYLTGEELVPLDPVTPADESSIGEADSAIAVEILKSVAEDTTMMLDSGNDPDIKREGDGASVDWFNMIDEEVSEVLSGTIDVPVLDAPVLSPVTAEDVESILSSGSSSPVQDHDTIWMSTSPYASSDLDISSIETSMIEDVEVIPSDLEQLLAQVEKNETDPDYEPEELSFLVYTPTSSSKASSRTKPYSRSKTSKHANNHTVKETRILDRKERKKQQNKDAALRYRLKKKQESTIIISEVDMLEARNTELKDTLDQVTRDIKYLKNLLADVYKAKGLMKSL